MSKKIQKIVTIAIIIIFLNLMTTSCSKTSENLKSRIWVLQDKIFAEDGIAYEEFGKQASISGNSALIGVPEDNANGSRSGSVYVFTFNGTHWVQTQKIIPSDITTDDRFGYSISVQGDVAVIGAPMGNGIMENSGAVYVFIRNNTTWNQQAKLYPSNEGTFFGSSVSYSGNTILIGAPYDIDYGNDAGAAYVFIKSEDNWIFQQKIIAFDVQSESRFGISLCINNNTALIRSLNQYNVGAVYVFTKSGTVWTQQQKITPTDGGLDYGISLSLTDTDAIIGSPKDNNLGAVYVYSWNGVNWTQIQKIIASDGESDDRFGWSLSTNGYILAIGMSDNNNPGAVYVFNKNNSSWIQTCKIPAPSENDWGFGNAVSLNYSHLIIGVPNGNGHAQYSGNAYVFKGPNQPPDAPTITGPAWGITNTTYNFTIHISDPDNDQIQCLIDWNDGNTSDWLGPYQSDTIINTSHAWDDTGNVTIRVKIKDPSDLESPWSLPHPIDVHSLKKTIMFGRYANLTTKAGLYVVDAKDLRLIHLHPMQWIHYIGEEEVLFARNYRGIMTSQIIIGVYNVVY